MSELQFNCYFCKEVFLSELELREHSLFVHNKFMTACYNRNRDSLVFKLFAELGGYVHGSVTDFCPNVFSDKYSRNIRKWEYEQSIRFQSILNHLRKLGINYFDSPAYFDIKHRFQLCSHDHPECGLFDPNKEYEKGYEKNREVEESIQRLEEFGRTGIVDKVDVENRDGVFDLLHEELKEREEIKKQKKELNKDLEIYGREVSNV